MRKFLEIPKRIHHAIIILSLLAGHKGKYAASLSRISQNLKMSYGYLEHIAAPLKKAGLIKSYRGSAGGYRLAKKPSDISVFDIISVLEGNMGLAACLGSGKCKAEAHCPSKKIHVKLQNELNGALQRIKISDFEKSLSLE